MNAGDRYAAPKALLGEAVAEPPMERPAVVTAGLVMLCLLLGSFVCDGFVTGFRLVRQQPFVGAAVILVGAVFAALVAWLLWKTFLGRNWARLALIVPVVLDPAFRIHSLVFTNPLAPFPMTAKAYFAVLCMVALHLAGYLMLFLPSANAWFRSR